MSCRPSPGLTGPGRTARNGERLDDGGEVTDDHREARITVIIGPGEVKDLRIESDFEPQRLIVDPDALVLQLHRHEAVEDLQNRISPQPTQQTTRGLRCQSVPTAAQTARQGPQAAVVGQDSACQRRFTKVSGWALHSCLERSAVEPGEGQMGNVGLDKCTHESPNQLRTKGVTCVLW